MLTSNKLDTGRVGGDIGAGDPNVSATIGRDTRPVVGTLEVRYRHVHTIAQQKPRFDVVYTGQILDLGFRRSYQDHTRPIACELQVTNGDVPAVHRVDATSVGGRVDEGVIGADQVVNGPALNRVRQVGVLNVMRRDTAPAPEVVVVATARVGGKRAVAGCKQHHAVTVVRGRVARQRIVTGVLQPDPCLFIVLGDDVFDRRMVRRDQANPPAVVGQRQVSDNDLRAVDGEHTGGIAARVHDHAGFANEAVDGFSVYRIGDVDVL